MAYHGYDAFEDPYSYPGTAILKNRLGVRDAGQLEALELELTTLRAEEPFPPGRFTPSHYRNIHHHLFQDVYSWAGRYRTVRTAKGGNWFCFPEHIPQEMNRLFASLRAQDVLRDLPPAEFVQGAAEFLATLNAIHPFREGNGRTQLAFLDLIAVSAGHPLRLGSIRPETFMPAMVRALLATYGCCQKSSNHYSSNAKALLLKLRRK